MGVSVIIVGPCPVWLATKVHALNFVVIIIHVWQS